MTEEHKQKIREGRMKALAEGKGKRTKKDKISKSDKVEVFLTGKEQNSYDFYDPVRLAFRKKKLFSVYPKILNEISNAIICNNPIQIKALLSKYAQIQYV